MKVLYISAECKPFSKAGGVGDVASELPAALRQKGIEIEILTPLYGQERSEFKLTIVRDYLLQFHERNEKITRYRTELKGVPVHLLGNQHYFSSPEPYIHSEDIPFYDDIIRFSFFCEACLLLIREINPDIVHINDWALCFLFGRMAMLNFPQKRVLTIHNIGYQGNIWRDNIVNWKIEQILNDPIIGNNFIDPRLNWNSVNPLRLGMELADIVNTVSPHYADELLLPEDQSRYFEGGKGLEEVAVRRQKEGAFLGILNGFDYKSEPSESSFNETIKQKADMKLALSNEFINPNNFLIGFVGRAVEQKFKLLVESYDGKTVFDRIVNLPGVNVAILTTGLPEYEQFLTRYADRGNVSITLAFDSAKARRISLGCDLFLMPSLYEPCGITQLESLSYATPPLVRWSGGLVDTVKSYTHHGGTGFGFDGSTKHEVLKNLINAVMTARDLWNNQQDVYSKLQWNGFNARFRWSDSAESYLRNIYEKLLRPSI